MSAYQKVGAGKSATWD